MNIIKDLSEITDGWYCIYGKDERPLGTVTAPIAKLDFMAGKTVVACYSYYQPSLKLVKSGLESEFQSEILDDEPMGREMI